MREILEKIKRPVALLVVLALWLALVPALYRTADAAGVGNWTDSGNFSASLAGGGTEASPYLIQSEQDLASLPAKYTSSTAYFKLTKDLDMTDHFWVPGSFSGVLDGDGHTVTGLRIKRDGATASGFIGMLTGTVKNLHLENVDMTFTGTSAGKYGGIAGVCQGTIDNCVVTGSIRVTLTNSTGNSYVGGIAGLMDTANKVVMNCVSSANVTISTPYGQFAAGIIGGATKAVSIKNCVNFGTITVSGGASGQTTYASGIVCTTSGSTVPSVSNCYNAGTFVNNNVAGTYKKTNDIYTHKSASKNISVNAWALNSEGTYKAVSANTADCADNTALLTALNTYVTANAATDSTLRSWEMGGNGPVPSFAMMGEDLPTFTADLTAGSSLEMNFYFEKANLNASTYTAKITKTFADNREAVVKSIPFADWTEEGGLYRFSFSDISAKEMTDAVTIVILDENDEEVTKVYTQTVESCARRAIGATDNAQLKTALADLLNYGAACQTHFGYNTGNLASPGVYSDYATAADVTCDSNPTDTQNLDSTSLFAYDTLTYTFYFKSITQDMTATVTYTDHKGQPQTLTVEGSKFVVNGDLAAVNVPIAFADGRTAITCEVKNGDTVVAKGTDSVEGYVARTLAANAGNTNLCSALNMLMRFVDSAKAYADSLSA